MKEKDEREIIHQKIHFSMKAIFPMERLYGVKGVPKFKSSDAM